MNTKFSQTENSNLYGVEIIRNIAYTSYLGDTSVYHAKYKDNDFVDTKLNCLEFINSKGIIEIYGVLSKDSK
ncbi:MAG: hypothetical protein KAI79_16690 [Bacteroidales bacterium]|nr:hypothetical protein [Bacteroidales bacterium]